MISVIISSANPSLLAQVSKNIEATIAVPYELISFDNSAGQKGICEIYNLGIQQAQYDILCFMHEDIGIKTDGWGKIVQKIFDEHNDYGLIGVAGSDYKTLAPSGWSGSGRNMDYANLVQSYKFKKKEPHHYYKNPRNEKLTEVACIDGVWFCVPRKIAAEIGFDQDTFKGFHLYDLDFSFAVGCKYKIGVIYDVLIDHFSEGNYDKTWMEETLKLHHKWYYHLPLNILPHSKASVFDAEKSTFKYFIERLIYLKFPMRVAFQMLYKDNRFLKMSPGLFFKLHYYILKKYISG